MDSRRTKTSTRGRIARVADIDIYVHWTFGLLVLWILMSHLGQGQSVATAVEGVLFVLAIFACVVLHELGHALTARRYGIRTRDITLYPIGGVARLERMPERPIEELWVALAGPAVNLVIAGGLVVALAAGHKLFGLGQFDLVGGSFWVKLAQVNLALALFNLLPAFPMDGGRVLRALLALRMEYTRATQYAATAGRVLAIGFGIIGFFYNPILLFIALFVFIGAQQEAQAVHAKSLLLGVPVRQAMVRDIRVLHAHEPLAVAVEALLATDHKDFPVVTHGQVVGMLSRDDLLRALAEGREQATVGDAMSQSCDPVEPGEMLDAVYTRMQAANCNALPVIHGGTLVGIVTLENIGEWMLVHAAVGRSRHESERSRAMRSP